MSNEPKPPSPFRAFSTKGIEVMVRYSRYGCARDFDGEPYVDDAGRNVLVGRKVDEFLDAAAASDWWQ